MVRGLALAFLLAFAAIPATTAQVPSLDIPEEPIVQPAIEALAAPAAEVGLPVGVWEAAAPAAFEGVCASVAAPATTGPTDSTQGLPVVVGGPEDGDQTGVDFGGSTGDGTAVRACVIPCSPVSAIPPEIRHGCIDDWTWFICGSSCVTVVNTVREAVCGGGCKAA